MSGFRLNKPPIIESRIAFDFEPAPDKREWDGELANDLAESLANRFPKKEFVWQGEFQVVRPAEGQLPVPRSFQHKLVAVRIRNEQDTRVFQISDDRAVVSQLKGDDDWPGFEHLLNDALELVDRYCEVFKPAGTKLATLHDVDLVEIPAAPGAEVKMDEYLTIVNELPQQPFGLIQGYFSAYVTVSPLDDEPLQIVSQLVPAPSDAHMLRIRLDWEKRCAKVDFSSKDTIRTGLLRNHRFVVDCFRSAFTPNGLALFEPQEM